MQAVLKGIHSPDVDDLESWQPEDEGGFGILVTALVGPKGGAGEEGFDFTVCSPEWLAQATSGRDEPILGRHHIIMSAFDFDKLRKLIERVVHRAEGRDWPEIANKIARHGHWEFEDYTE